MDEKIDILLSRYFSGEASGQELQSLDQWLSESTENEAYFEKMTTIFQHAALIKPMPEPDTEKALSAFKNYIEKEKNLPQKTVVQKLIPYFSVAASIALIIGISLFFFKKPDTCIVANETALQQTLFDGVNVSLKAGSEIKYNPGNIREITLTKGEATFEVNTSQDENLLIRAGKTFIEDIGTVFTVTAYNPEESITVEVSEGEILFYTKNNSGIYIKQSEKGIYHTQKDYFEHITSLAGIKAIEFDATPLSEVINILSVQYGAKIKTNADSLNKLQISVGFDPNETIENILSIISETLSMHVAKEPDGVFVFSY
jgi:ferric-dicitrate binding protein FerR (iron transport regulator)